MVQVLGKKRKRLAPYVSPRDQKGEKIQSLDSAMREIREVRGFEPPTPLSFRFWA